MDQNRIIYNKTVNYQKYSKLQKQINAKSTLISEAFLLKLIKSTPIKTTKTNYS